MALVAIGNGLYWRAGGESVMDAYRRMQRECEHSKRDPRGVCYRCGHQSTVSEDK